MHWFWRLDFLIRLGYSECADFHAVRLGKNSGNTKSAGKGNLLYCFDTHLQQRRRPSAVEEKVDLCVKWSLRWSAPGY